MPIQCREDHVPDGSGSVTCTVSQLEILTLNNFNISVCQIYISMQQRDYIKKMCLEVNSSFVIVWAGLPTCWCIIMCIYIVMLHVTLPICCDRKLKSAFSVWGNTVRNIKCWYCYLILFTYHYRRELYAHRHNPDCQIQCMMMKSNLK